MATINSRGIGFDLYSPSTAFTSEADIMNRLTEIPLYSYVIISNVNSEEHGRMYQKNYDANGNAVANYVFTITGSIAKGQINAEDLTIIDNSNSDLDSKSLSEYVEDLVSLLAAI